MLNYLLIKLETKLLRLFKFCLKGRAGKVKFDLKGDGFQNGGLLIVKKGGQEVLLSYRQVNVAEHVKNSAVLKALGLSEDAAQQEPDNQTEPTIK